MQPKQLILHQKSATLEIVYPDNTFTLAAGYLRMKSPAADNKGKMHIYHEKASIEKVVLVGNYAVNIVFSDGHKSGIYSWDYVRSLCVAYEREMQKIEKQREVQKQNSEEVQVLNIQAAPKKFDPDKADAE